MYLRHGFSGDSRRKAQNPTEFAPHRLSAHKFSLPAAARTARESGTGVRRYRAVLVVALILLRLLCAPLASSGITVELLNRIR